VDKAGYVEPFVMRERFKGISLKHAVLRGQGVKIGEVVNSWVRLVFILSL
jgi:hypothetical protein